MQMLMRRQSVTRDDLVFSFGQMILFPWSHTSERGPDYDKHMAAGRQMANGIKAINNASYSCGSVGGILCKSPAVTPVAMVNALLYSSH